MMLEHVSAGLPLWAVVSALGVALVAGLIKGALGFAMPMILISGLSSFMSVELALAGLMLPTLFTNISQALRQGWQAAWGSVRKYWRMLSIMVVLLLLSAQLVSEMSDRLLLILLGGPIVLFALVQLAGVPLRINVHRRRRAEWFSGGVAGLYGGISGIWGPPVMIYLISVDTGKRDMVRVLGVVFLVGAVALIGGHVVSGVATVQTLSFSALLVIPGMIGLWLGYVVQDRLDPAQFRRWTLIMLALTGLNLLRQAVA